MRGPRILMFAPACYPPSNPESIVNAKLALAMARAGWGVDVITWSDMRAYYPVRLDNSWAELARIVHPVVACKGWSGGDALLKPLTALQTGHLVQGLAWAGKAIRRACAIASSRHYDLILSRSSPLVGHLPALHLRSRMQVPWIANWNDPEPTLGHYPPPYGMGPSCPMAWYLKRFISAVAESADWHTFPCERLRKYMCSYIGESRRMLAKSSVIPHIALVSERQGRSSSTSVFTLCHAGAVRPPRDASAFLRGLRKLLDRLGSDDLARVRFIGEHPAEDFLNEIGTLNLGQVVSVEPSRTYEDTLAILEQADVLVVIEAPCEEGVFLPSKFVDYIQAKRPILAVGPPNGTLADLLVGLRGGLAVDCRSADGVCEALSMLYEKWRSGSLEALNSGSLLPLFDGRFVLAEYQRIREKICYD